MGVLLGLFGSEAFTASPGKRVGGLYAHKLLKLPYPEVTLEPVIHKQTVQFRFNKHFAGYINGLNAMVAKIEEARKSGNYGAIKALRRDLAFTGSGVVLHYLFFMLMGPNAEGTPSEKIGEQIKKDFGSFDLFWKQFAAASTDVEALGWGVLAWEPFSKCLVIMQAEKHQNLTSWGAVLVMVCDVWEHAYYIKYQNRRAEYVDDFKKVIDRKKFSQHFQMFFLAK